jgi:hypothetical protein
MLTRIPGPADQRILGHMVDNLIELPSTIPVRILDLSADFAKGLADPRHLNGGQMPFWMSWHATRVKIGMLVARRAVHADGTEAARASHHERLVRMPVVPLLRPIASRMAIHASGIVDYFACFSEESD